MTAEHVGDMANRVARQLQNDHVAEILAAPVQGVDEAEKLNDEVRRSIFTKLEFKWRTSDERSLEQMRAAADAMFGTLYDEIITAIDGLYASVRVPLLDENDMVVKDARGRVAWQKDSKDRVVEDWSRLTGQDLETCLLDLARLRLLMAAPLNELLLEAVFAKHVMDDIYADAHSALMDGTIPDRHAHASRESRQDKYFAFFKYYLYSQARVFHDEIVNFARLIERIRYWRLDEQDRR